VAVLGLLVVCGFGFMVQMAASNTFIQTIVDDDKRGRVMSLFIMAFLAPPRSGA
jgi:MFS family permease